MPQCCAWGAGASKYWLHDRALYANDRSNSVRMVSMLLIAASGVAAAAASATPLQDCTQSSVPSVCLDAKLKAANKQLNATLKAAQDRIEQLQAQGRRPVLGTF